MIGRTLGHYEIVALIGRGGMGEVYRARDTKLDRDVALKVLPREVAKDPHRLERFLREAKTVAGLNHPHIVTLHSVEEAGGVRFLVMELVEGQGLDRLLTTEGLPIKQVVEIGVAVADALATAHEKGVVHRDLKPANVMITKDGRPKVLDFGIAKTAPHELGDTQTAQPLTRDGMVMGTVPHMSPEQVRGGRVDQRSDIFSLGTLLYQLTTGALPFHGDYEHAIGYAIVNTSQRPIAELRGDVPAALVAIIDKCLAKEPAQRYASAVIVRDELRALQTQTGHRVATATQRHGQRAWIGITAVALAVAAVSYYLVSRHTATAVQSKSIAVLPFVNMSGDASQDFFSDGISEELLNLLAQIPELKVAARTSSFSFKGKEIEIPEIGQRLNVSHVLEGSVRRAGDRVRITAQLVQTKDGFHVWSQTYDRTLNDVFSMQDEIAADVVKELKVSFLGETPRARTTDPRAYALFLQGRDVARQLSPRSLALSDSLYQAALAIDSTYAPAWVGLSSNYVNEISFGFMKSSDGFRLSREAALKALEHDPDNGVAYSRLGIIAMWFDNDLAAAARYFERAVALDPDDPVTVMNTGNFLMLIGRHDEQMALLRSALVRDPVNVNFLQNLGSCEVNTRHFDDGIAKLRTALELNPGLNVMHYTLGIAYVLKGDPKTGLVEMQREGEEFRRCGLPIVYHALERKADSDAALKELIDKDAEAAAYNIAQCYAYRNQRDLAFQWLDRANELHDPGLNAILIDPLLAGLQNDPRWHQFLARIGRSPEQLQEIHFKMTIPSGTGKASS